METSDTSTQDQPLLAAIAVGIAPSALKTECIQHLARGGSLSEIAAHLPNHLLKRAGEIRSLSAALAIEIVPFYADHYPELLRQCAAPPAAIYVRSGTPRFNWPARMIAVVGTRAASVETCQRASLLALHLAQHGVCIVSGLALGVDGAAHRGALESHTPAPTLAVLAHGLDRIYPSSHQPLSDSILSRGGALISEYPPGAEPLKHHFLERNRIIAALAIGTVVVQAGQRSGSLVTARFAADYGRDVFIMESPTNSTANADQAFCGGAQLIDDGAIPIAGAREVLEEYGITVASSNSTPSSASWVTLTIDEYRKVTGHSAAQMLKLELEGRVVRLPGDRITVQI